MDNKRQALNILIVEDQQSIAQNIADYMTSKGYTVDFAINGRQGLQLVLDRHYDVVVLDLGLPKLDGLEVCKRIREKANRHVPILMLTARDSIDDKLSGFHAGAEDYLTKPFSLQELEVRCLGLSRRHLLHSKSLITLGPLELSRQRQRISRSGKVLPLSTMGYKILTHLIDAYPRVVSRSELLQALWGDEPTESDAMRSHIYQLRSVLDKPYDNAILKTVHGVGFTLDIEDEI